MFFRSKSAATATVEAPVATAPPFPSPDAVARIRELIEQIAKAKAELATAERALALTVKNREAVELFAGNPDEVVRKARAAADVAKAKLSGLQNEFARAFVNEGARCQELRSAAWARTFNEVVLPLAERFTAIAEDFERAVDDVAALFRDDSDAAAQFNALDAGMTTWNKFVAELSGPGNAVLDSKSFLATVRESLAQNLKIRDRLEATLARLKNAINPPPLVPKPLTEEEVARIREDQRLASAARSKALDDEDARAQFAR